MKVQVLKRNTHGSVQFLPYSEIGDRRCSILWRLPTRQTADADHGRIRRLSAMLAAANLNWRDWLLFPRNAMLWTQFLSQRGLLLNFKLEWQLCAHPSSVVSAGCSWNRGLTHISFSSHLQLMVQLFGV